MTGISKWIEGAGRLTFVPTHETRVKRIVRPPADSTFPFRRHRSGSTSHSACTACVVSCLTWLYCVHCGTLFNRHLIVKEKKLRMVFRYVEKLCALVRTSLHGLYHSARRLYTPLARSQNVFYAERHGRKAFGCFGLLFCSLYSKYVMWHAAQDRGFDRLQSTSAVARL